MVTLDMNESIETQELRERVACLEARIDALERALAAVTGSQAAPTERKSLAQTLKLAILGTPVPGVAPVATVAAPSAPFEAAAAQLVRAAAMPAPPADRAVLAAEPPVDIKPAMPDSRPALDQLNMTDAFASLDLRVAEAAEAESSLGRSSGSKAGMLEIDATLIDKAFARPPPEKLFVRAAIEELHPKIAERVVNTWRTNELLQYLRKLIVDERGDRAGFAPAVMSELLLLSAILEAPDEKDAWATNARQT